METKFCHSCGIPISGEAAAKNTDKFCQYCADENGNLKSKEEVKAGLIQWLQGITPDDINADYQKRAEFYMKSMPAWAE
ncbi:MAG: zinc ribbon domain-containing protein [bacterium]